MKRVPFKRKPSKWGKKRSEKSKLKDQVNKLWADCVKWNKEYCEYCGKDKTQVVFNAHHIVTRGDKATLFDLDNGITLCRYCHKFIAHDRHETFRPFLIEWLGKRKLSREGKDTSDRNVLRAVGEEVYALLQYKAEQYHKPDYLLELIRLKAELSEREKAPL